MLNELNTWKHKTVYITVAIWFALWFFTKYILWILIFTPIYFLLAGLPYLVLFFPVVFFFTKGNRTLKIITSLVSLAPLLYGILIPHIIHEIKLRNTLPQNQAFIGYVDDLRFRSSESLMINDSLFRYDKETKTLYIKLMLNSNKITDDINNYFKDRDRSYIPNYFMNQIFYYFVNVPEEMNQISLKPSKLICEAYWDNFYLGDFGYKKDKESYVLEGAVPKLSLRGIVEEKKWILQAEDSGMSINIPLAYGPLSNQKVTLEDYLRNWRS